ncbi:MAG TPA: hypothetical protein VNI54_18570 [Thermoanaerobaculia bacterium]|nr:hypothetical protein [Thermoanaerobaculia bacterium]
MIRTVFVRALVTLLLILFSGFVRAACVDDVRIPVGPRAIETQCSYWSADVAAEGGVVAGAWVTSTVVGLSRPYSVGSTWGGVLDGRGRLRSSEHLPMSEDPGYPSLATNGQMSMLAWGRTDSGTYVQFLDANGARIGDAVRVASTGATAIPPRAVWDGRDWRVILNENGGVWSLQIRTDGAQGERTVIAAEGTLADADRDRVVISTGAGFAIITPQGRHPLPAIPAGASVALDGDLLAWNGSTTGAQRLDAFGAPQGNPIALGTSAEAGRVAVAGDVVLWSDGATVFGARIGTDDSVRALTPLDGTLHAAADTTDGVVALISGACFRVNTHFLAPGANRLEAHDTLSRATALQEPQAFVATGRGHHVFWSEERPSTGNSRLYVTSIEGRAAHPPVVLSDLSTSIAPVAAAPLDSGSVVAWVEYVKGQAPATLKLARLDADGNVLGTPVTLATTGFIFDMDIVARGEEVIVVTDEHASFAWQGVYWKTTVAADGTVRREQLGDSSASAALSVAQARDRVFVSWYEYHAESNSRRLIVRDDEQTRVFPTPLGIDGQFLFGGDAPMVLWSGAEGIHALFPESSVDVVVGQFDTHGPSTMEASLQPDGSFHIAWTTNTGGPANIHTVNVTPNGIVTPVGDMCFDAPATHLSMRGKAVDAVLTRDGAGALHVVRRAPTRRRVASP